MVRGMHLVAHLASATALQAAEGAPDWIHLLPAGVIRTQDGRGPYRAEDLATIVLTSLQGVERRLPRPRAIAEFSLMLGLESVEHVEDLAA